MSDQPPRWGEPGYVPPPPPQWGEPGYVPRPPTREQLKANRRGTGLLCLILAPPAVLFFVGGVVGYATLEPGQDDFGAAMSVVFALLFGIPAVVLGLRWQAASRSLRQRADEPD